jgi:hypothetical protein
MAVRLIRDALRRAEVNAAGHGSARVIVEHGDVDPVLAPVEQREAHPRRGDRALRLEVAPESRAQRTSVLGDGERRRGDGGDLNIGRAGARVLRLSPALEGVVQEVVRRCPRQRVHVGGDTAIHLRVQVKAPVRVLGLGQVNPHLAPALADEGMLVQVSQCDRGDHEPRTLRHDLDDVDHMIRLRVRPGPERIATGSAAGRLGLAQPQLVPPALVSGGQPIVLVAHREEGHVAPPGTDHLDLESLADRHAQRLPAGEAEHVLRHLPPQHAAVRHVRLQQSVGEDHTPRRPTDRDRHGAGRAIQSDKAVAAVHASDDEGEAAQGQPPRAHLLVLAQQLHSRVAPCQQVERLIVSHGVSSVTLVAEQCVAVYRLWLQHGHTSRGPPHVRHGGRMPCVSTASTPPASLSAVAR